MKTQLGMVVSNNGHVANNCHNAINLNKCKTVKEKTSKASENEQYIYYQLLKNNFLTWDKIYLHCAFNKKGKNETITLL